MYIHIPDIKYFRAFQVHTTNIPDQEVQICIKDMKYSKKILIHYDKDQGIVSQSCFFLRDIGIDIDGYCSTNNNPEQYILFTRNMATKLQ